MPICLKDAFLPKLTILTNFHRATMQVCCPLRSDPLGSPTTLLSS